MICKGVSGSAIANKPATGTIHQNLEFKIKSRDFKMDLTKSRVAQFWSEILLVILNRNCAARSLDFETTRMISDQTKLHSVPLLLH